MKNKGSLVILLAVTLSYPALIFAETIILKSGQNIKGKIVERSDKYIKIDFHGLMLTRYNDDIDKIIEDNGVIAPLEPVPQMPQKIVAAAPRIPALINWQNNLDESFGMARRDSKPVMVDFYTDWCGWCKKLDSDTYSEQSIRELSEQFVCVKINADNNRSAAERYNVRGFPTIIFLSPNGDILKTVPGYADASALSKIMKDVLGKVSKK